VPVDGSGFVPSLLNPGDLITFIIPTADRSAPVGRSEIEVAVRSYEEVGPFRIKTLGNRLASTNTMRGNQLQEREIGIVLQEENGKLEAKAQKLQDLLARSNRRNISIRLDEKAKR
jgi:hypothetical protein